MPLNIGYKSTQLIKGCVRLELIGTPRNYPNIALDVSKC